jgi:hypothetical protein
LARRAAADEEEEDAEEDEGGAAAASVAEAESISSNAALDLHLLLENAAFGPDEKANLTLRDPAPYSAGLNKQALLSLRECGSRGRR